MAGNSFACLSERESLCFRGENGNRLEVREKVGIKFIAVISVKKLNQKLDRWISHPTKLSFQLKGSTEDVL